MEVYLDNAATTIVYEPVKEIMLKTMTQDYGNPSSLHMKGVEAEKYVKTAREIIAAELKCKDKEIVFTSGGTESNNMAIIGTVMANKRRGNHIITTQIEHPSVAMPVKYLEEQGFRVTRLGVDEHGVISLKELEESICDETILVSVMYVNNEVGSIQPIDEIAEIIQKKNPDIRFHVDAIQAFGKIRIYPKRQNIDLLSVSGHKIHGPKGTGFLYIREKVNVNPIIFGGGQQKNMRSGTENVPGIAGMGEAVKILYKDFDKKIENLRELKDYFIDEVSKIEGATVNSRKGKSAAPHIVSVSFDGIKSEVMLHSLEDKKIYVSAGSACSSNKQSVSATLKAMGLPAENLDSTVRFSFSPDTGKEELDYTLNELKNIVPMLRKYVHM